MSCEYVLMFWMHFHYGGVYWDTIRATVLYNNFSSQGFNRVGSYIWDGSRKDRRCVFGCLQIKMNWFTRNEL